MARKKRVIRVKHQQKMLNKLLEQFMYNTPIGAELKIDGRAMVEKAIDLSYPESYFDGQITYNRRAYVKRMMLV